MRQSPELGLLRRRILRRRFPRFARNDMVLHFSVLSLLPTVTLHAEQAGPFPTNVFLHFDITKTARKLLPSCFSLSKNYGAQIDQRWRLPRRFAPRNDKLGVLCKKSQL